MGLIAGDAIGIRPAPRAPSPIANTLRPATLGRMDERGEHGGDTTNVLLAGESQARMFVFRLRKFYFANILLCATVLLILWMAKADTFPLVAFGGMTILMTAIRIVIAYRPRPAAAAAACAWTAVIVFMGAKGLFGANLRTLIGCLWTLACWAMLAPAGKLADLMTEPADSVESA